MLVLTGSQQLQLKAYLSWYKVRLVVLNDQNNPLSGVSATSGVQGSADYKITITSAGASVAKISGLQPSLVLGTTGYVTMKV
jgi:hypothetical protein